jgi:hypothetical protein
MDRRGPGVNGSFAVRRRAGPPAFRLALEGAAALRGRRARKVQASVSLAIRTTPLAGPRRAPPRPTGIVGDAVGTRVSPEGSVDAAPASVGTRRTERLASLDFEDGGTRPGARSMEATQPGHRARMQRIRWFAYGILVGTVGSAVGGGGAEILLGATCEWSTGVVRAFGCGAVNSPPASPMDLAVAPVPSIPQASVPTVRVDDLPAAKDPGPDSRGPTRAP